MAAASKAAQQGPLVIGLITSAMVGALQQLGWVAIGDGDRSAPLALFQRAAETSATVGDPELDVASRAFLGLLLLGSGEIVSAENESSRALVLRHAHGLSRELGRIELTLGLIALQRNDIAAARRRLDAAGFSGRRNTGSGKRVR